MRTAVVIPAYNESATIADVVARACQQMDWVIVVDDGSVDDTVQRIAHLPVTVLRHTHNRGKGASLWLGITFALARGAAAVITLDADDQHRPEDIPRLLEASRQYPDKIIIAARLNQRAQVPGIRRFANGMADFWISWAAGYPIRDTQSGFRLYPAAVLNAFKTAPQQKHGFVFESEILIEAGRRGYYSLPVAIDSIYQKKARASYYRPFADTAWIVRMVAWKLISRGLYPQGLLRSVGLLPCPGSGFGPQLRD